MSPEAPRPAPVEVQAAQAPNAAQLMQEWATFPAEEAKVVAEEVKKAADVSEANALFAKNEGAQSSLPHNAKGEYIPNSPEKSRVSRVAEDGSVEHLNKAKVTKDAEKAQSLLGYEETVGLDPVKAIPAMREKRIADIKAELTAIADRHVATSGSEKVTDSVGHSRALKAELNDLMAISRADAPKVEKAPSTTKASFAAPEANAIPKTVEATGFTVPDASTKSGDLTTDLILGSEPAPTGTSERDLGEDIEFTKPGGANVVNPVASEQAQAPDFKTLNDELAKKVATGDLEGWDELTATLEAAVAYDANKRGAPVDERVQTFKDYATRKRAELIANQGTTTATTEGATPLVVEVPAANAAPTAANAEPAAVESTGFAAPDASTSLGALGDLNTGPILASELTPAQLIAISDQVRTPENAKKIDFALAEQARRLAEGEPMPTSSTAVELFNKGDALQAVTPETAEVEKKKRRIWRKVGALALVGIAAFGIYKGVSGSGDAVPKGPAPVEAPVADDDGQENPEFVIDEGTGDIAGPEDGGGDSGESESDDATTFTIEKPYEAGDMTAWSWAESLGIPSGNVQDFLTDVMGPDYSQQARNLKVGDSISATPEQIAKYINTILVSS